MYGCGPRVRELRLLINSAGTAATNRWRTKLKMQSREKKPELMSPAGHWPQLRAAIAAGADAVYFGLNHFTARAKVGFTPVELPDVMRELHQSAVKGFVTFNTLVFDHEINQATDALKTIEQAGVDAVIVQDVGVAKLIGQIVPNLEIHGSTQMSVTSAQGVELARSLGCTRVVLGRELDLKDIRRIANATDVELEVFVHGALCVSYSGQCFSSEAWGGRSANRGKCAQACRLSYDLIVDGHQRDLGEYRYLLSPGDLHAIDQIPELVDIGISCVKIEGRYKDADYVTLTTRAYREAIDRAVGSTENVESVPKKELEQIYSRGLGPHFMSGVNHQNVVRGRAPRHRGLQVGSVVDVRPDSVVVKPSETIHPGDGLVFDSASWRSPDEPEEGGNVYEVELAGETCVLKFGRGDIDFGRIRAGDLVWRTSDPKLAKKIASSNFNNERAENGLVFEVQANASEPLKINATASRQTTSFISDEPLQVADKRALEMETLTEQLGRLGKTPFHLQDIKFETTGDVFCPVSLLNQARRQLVDDLLAQREQRHGSHHSDSSTIEKSKEESKKAPTKAAPKNVEIPQLHVLVRRADQLEAAIECRPASITLDYLELYGLRPSVEKIQQANIAVRVASPRILKPNEQKIIRFLLSLNCQILVRSGGLLHDLVKSLETLEENAARPALFGDFSLNAANAISSQLYLDMGVQRIAPTHDLNAQQIIDLAQQLDPQQLEVIAYHHLPVFHTEHCVFCRFLSDGTDNTNCGHPCEKHQIAIQDAQGRQHPVMADVGCRNTVFGAEAQTAGKFMDQMIASGLKHFRLEFVHESPEDVRQVCEIFANFFSGSIDQNQLQSKLETISPSGTTEGSLFVPRNFKQLVKLQ